MKAVRGVVGVIIVLVLFFLVLNWVGDYRNASKKPATSKTSASSEASGSVDTSGEDPAAQDAATDEEPVEQADAVKGVLLVEVDGLNLRKKADSKSAAIRGLKKGERVELLEDLGDWYKVRDQDGTMGYITSNSSYTRSVE